MKPFVWQGRHVAITAWHNRQLCNDISGDVLGTFVNTHSALCAPEPPVDPDTGLAATAAKLTATCGAQTPTPAPAASTTVSSSPTGTASTTPTPTPSGTPSVTTSATTSKTPSPSAS